jgi:hypothetical protein
MRPQSLHVSTLPNAPDRSLARVFLTAACAFYKSTAVRVTSSCRKDTIDREEASVTDEAPARDSAGHGGPVE